MNKSFGRIAFEAYRENRNGITHDGRQIPKWETLSEEIKNAWCAAGNAVWKQIIEDADKLLERTKAK